MKAAIMASIVAMLASAASAMAAFVVTSKNIQERDNSDDRHQRQGQAGAKGKSRTSRVPGGWRARQDCPARPVRLDRKLTRAMGGVLEHDPTMGTSSCDGHADHASRSPFNGQPRPRCRQSWLRL
jgi:hypothetical protein